MSTRLINTIPFLVNAAVQAGALVWLLEPKFRRLPTALACWSVMAVLAVLFGPMLNLNTWSWIVMFASVCLTVVLLFRDSTSRKISIVCLLQLTEITSSVLLLPAAPQEAARTLAEIEQMAALPHVALPRLWSSLVFLIAIVILLIWVRPQLRHSIGALQPGFAYFVFIETLMQVVLLIMMVQLADLAIDLPVITALWLINCCSLCLIAAFLGAAVRESRHAAQLARAQEAARLQEQLLPGEQACLERARQIRSDVFAQLDKLTAQIQDGQSALPVPDLMKAPQFASSLAVNALIEHKAAQAAGRGITLTCRGRIEIPHLSEFSLCAIVANLLDNAMSSASGPPSWIRLHCVQRSGIRSLVCINPVRQEKETSGGSAGSGGLGLSIIRAATLEAGGRMYLQRRDGTFSVILSFSDDAGSTV